MSKTIEIQNVQGTETWDVVVKVAGVERLRFGPVNDLVAAGLDRQGNGEIDEPWGMWDTYFFPVADDYDVAGDLPEGTPCVETPPMPADAPKGKIEQELEAMAAKLDAILLRLGSGGQVGTQLADMAAAQIRMEAQMADIAKMRGEWKSDQPVTRLPVMMVTRFPRAASCREAREQVESVAGMTGVTPVTMNVTQAMIDKASADAWAAAEVLLKQHGFTQEMIDEAREQMESVTGMTRVTGKGNGNEGNSVMEAIANKYAIAPAEDDLTGDSSTADSSTDLSASLSAGALAQAEALAKEDH